MNPFQVGFTGHVTHWYILSTLYKCCTPIIQSDVVKLGWLGSSRVKAIKSNQSYALHYHIWAGTLIAVDKIYQCVTHPGKHYWRQTFQQWPRKVEKSVMLKYVVLLPVMVQQLHDEGQPHRYEVILTSDKFTSIILNIIIRSYSVLYKEKFKIMRLLVPLSSKRAK